MSTIRNAEQIYNYSLTSMVLIAMPGATVRLKFRRPIIVRRGDEEGVHKRPAAAGATRQDETVVLTKRDVTRRAPRRIMEERKIFVP